ncbi:MAG: hypothetical protein U0414_35650 [Polyangiaceae bacterium]
MYSDWYLAFPGELEDLVFASAEELETSWRSVALEDVLEVELMALGRVLLGEDYAYKSELLHPEGARIDDTFSDDITSQPAEAGVYALRIADDLVAALARISDAELPGIAGAWRARAKQLRAKSAGEVEATLGEMRRFSRDAARLGKMVVNLFEV